MSQQTIYGNYLQPANCPQPQNQPEQKNTFCCCSTAVLGFLSVLLAATLGLILGASFAATILTALAALIILAVVLAILIIALLIIRHCLCCKRKKCCG